MYLFSKLTTLTAGLLFLTGCSFWGQKTGFLGLAPIGDRQEYMDARDLYEQGRYKEAIEDLSEYIYKTKNVKRREVRAYRLLGKSYEQLDNLSKAMEVYQEALEFHPKDIQLLLASAELYQQADLTDRSMELYERVLSQEPDNTAALAGQAANYSRIGFYSKARALYDQFFEVSPTATPQHRARYADTFLRQRNYEDAFIHTTRALAADSSSPDFWLLSAEALRGLGRPQEALAQINTALLLAPNRPDLLAHKALWLFEAKEYQESLQTAQLMLTQQPDNQLALFILAMDTYRMGRKKEALGYMIRAKEAKPDSFIGQVAAKLLLENENRN